MKIVTISKLSTLLTIVIFNTLLTPILFAAEAVEAVTEQQTSETPSSLPMTVLPLDEVRIFTEVLNQIRSSYVEPIDDQTLLENAIRGMLDGIDPHSSYLASDDFDELQESTTGEFGGLGIEVSTENGLIRIITPMDDSPAEKAGIKAGDLIIKLDDTPSRDVTLGDTVNIMRGEPGTPIVLTIIREGIDEPFEITVIRDIIVSRSVRSRTLEADYGYIRISQFAANTGNEVKDAVEDLHEENDSLKGIILDLRNNPGGLLQASVKVVDSFITEGLIVYTEGRLNTSGMQFEATPGDPSQGIPLVVLINQGSASASEIVAGALQDHKRALVMGTQSFGKGSVQTVLPLTNNRAIRLTTALYFTPNGRSIQATGIIPDIEVEQGQVTTIPANLIAYREEDLANHLANGNPDAIQSFPEVVESEEEQEILVRDYQLNEALNVLKGMNLLLQSQQSPELVQAQLEE